MQPQGQPDLQAIWKNRIFLGNAAAAENPHILHNLGITHILNMAAEMPTHYNDPNYPFVYKHIPMRDEENEDISHWLPHVYYYLEEAIESGGRVYVHCHMGVSRGATAVIYYIMIRKDWSFEKALQYVKHRRPQVNPNFGYACGVLHFVYTGAGPYQNAPVRVPLSVVLDEMMFVCRQYIGQGISRQIVERSFQAQGMHIENALRTLRSTGGAQQGYGVQQQFGLGNGYGQYGAQYQGFYQAPAEVPKRRARSLFDVLRGKR